MTAVRWVVLAATCVPLVGVAVAVAVGMVTETARHLTGPRDTTPEPSTPESSWRESYERHQLLVEQWNDYLDAQAADGYCNRWPEDWDEDSGAAEVGGQEAAS